jgi:hypothetical protein
VLTFDNLLLGLTLLAGAAAWYRALAAGERALDVVRRVCVDLGVQALDQTVALREWRLCRDERGRLALRRVYRFEFSTEGHDRHDGWIGFVGARLAWVRLDHPDGPIYMDTPLRRDEPAQLH